MTPRANEYELDFAVTSWFDSADADPINRATFASLHIDARGVPVTEVEDLIARTVRPDIHVSAYRVAQWLLVNWWRLRWEPRRDSRDWYESHSLAAIGDGYAWPALEFASDGDFISLRHKMEPEPDVAAVRYLRDLAVDVPAPAFEAAVDRFAEQVLGRLSSMVPEHRALHDVWEELLAERADPALSTLCRLQALAGIDPGAASEEWLVLAGALPERLGKEPANEVAALLPEMPEGFRSVENVIEAMRASVVRLDLGWTRRILLPSRELGLPWQRAARAAAEIRERLGIGRGPVDDRRLGELTGVTLPLDVTDPRANIFSGGFRSGAADGRVAVLVPSARRENQRFYLGRLVGAALLAGAADHLLPVTRAVTAFQKFERAFAQELLCPWQELKDFVDEHGVGEEAIEDAAAYFGVSPLAVQTVLVNKGVLERERLAV